MSVNELKYFKERSMSCFSDGVKDVREFFSGISFSSEAMQKAEGLTSVATKTVESVEVAKQSVTHVVRSGETLSTIAGKYENITYQDIAKANNISNPDNIYVGQRLNIPNQTSTPTPTTPAKPTPSPIKQPSDETSINGNKESGCEKCDFDWAKTPIIKLIISKESKGSYDAYNITGWKNGRNKVFESHFSPTSTYHIIKMTIQEIQNAQSTHIGPNKKHLFAVGLYQCIPKTLNSFLNWVSKYCTISKETQLFDKKFQDMLPWYFWEYKRTTVSKYFKGQISAESAAYAISKEWASAGTPKGYKIETGKISDGHMSYYGGDGLNKAHYSAEKTIAALKKTKQLLDKCGGYNKVKNEQLQGCK